MGHIYEAGDISKFHRVSVRGLWVTLMGLGSPLAPIGSHLWVWSLSYGSHLWCCEGTYGVWGITYGARIILMGFGVTLMGLCSHLWGWGPR